MKRVYQALAEEGIPVCTLFQNGHYLRFREVFQLLLTVVFLSFGSLSLAQNPRERLAVLDLGNPARLHAQEVGYLSDLIRDAAREQLSIDQFVIMTRENIVDLLGDRALSDCLGDCAVQTGRNLGAKYVVSGEVIRFGESLRLSVSLHETYSGNLLESEQARANEVEGLELPVRDMGRQLFQGLHPQVGITPMGGEATLGGGADAWSASGTGFIVVNFESKPPGATVEVDGIPICETPCSQALPAGSIEVSFKLLRYLPSSSVVMAKEGMNPVRATLKPNFGWLTVTSDPPGLVVEIDGKDTGITPIEQIEINCGLHEIWVRDPYRHDEGERVVIERGESESVHLEPVPINGGLRVDMRDLDGNALQGNILIEGRLLGRAWAPLTVQAGPRDVEFRGDQGRWRETVTVLAEELLVVEAELRGYLGADTNSIGMEMVRIPAGSFMMGSPSSESGRGKDEDQHRILLNHDFLLAATEVTQAQYEAVMGKNPSRYKGPERPVERVSWFDAVDFCNKLSEKEGLTPVYRVKEKSVAWIRGADGYRLPTEAEWEYACRATTRERFHSDNDKSDLGLWSWFYSNSRKKTHLVGEKLPNAWGLYDMHGNVWEWCWDWYGLYTAEKADPTGQTNGANRVRRGGGWDCGPLDCRSANRSRGYADINHSTNGFRPARSTTSTPLRGQSGIIKQRSDRFR